MDVLLLASRLPRDLCMASDPNAGPTTKRLLGSNSTAVAPLADQPSSGAPFQRRVVVLPRFDYCSNKAIDYSQLPATAPITLPPSNTGVNRPIA